MNRCATSSIVIAACCCASRPRSFTARPSILLLVGLWLLMMLVPGHAENDIWTRPNRENGPTPVQMHVFITDIDEINGANQTFTANVYYEVTWNDPRLNDEAAEGRRYQLDEIWHPRIVLVNQQKIWSIMPDTVQVMPGGTVTYRQQVWGNFSQPLDLHEFPFDTQKFTLQFASPDHGPGEIRFETRQHDENRIAEKLSLPDWQIENWELGPSAYQPVPNVPPIAGFTFTFTAKRDSGFYVIKVIVPLLLILMMASVVFWINPTEGGTQIGVSTTAMLTLIAYRFAVSSDLPNIPYLTRMDVFILAATVLVAVCLIEVVITSRLAARGRIETALRLDFVMRIVFPLTLALVGAYAFYLF